jgi:hypothetical protein
MQPQAEDIVAVRREMLDLLRRQREVLNSAPELTDSQLRECYDRQGRVQELREKLQAILNWQSQNRPRTVDGGFFSVACSPPSGALPGTGC